MPAPAPPHARPMPIARRPFLPRSAETNAPAWFRRERPGPACTPSSPLARRKPRAAGRRGVPARFARGRCRVPQAGAPATVAPPPMKIPPRRRNRSSPQAPESPQGVPQSSGRVLCPRLDFYRRDTRRPPEIRAMKSHGTSPGTLAGTQGLALERLGREKLIEEQLEGRRAGGPHFFPFFVLFREASMGGDHLYNSSGSNKPGVPHPCGFCKGGAFRSSSDAKGLRRCYGQKHLHFVKFLPNSSLTIGASCGTLTLS